MIEFEGRLGSGVSGGTFTFVPSSGEFEEGSKARLEVGSPAGLVLVVESDPAPTSPAVFEWDPGTGELTWDLSTAQITECGAGFHTMVFKIVRASGEPVHDVKTQTHQLHVLPWPAG